MPNPVSHRSADRPARSAREARRGFTLIELLVVITVVSILAAILVPAIRSAYDSARKKTTRGVIHQVGMALEQYQRAFGDYPPERVDAADAPGSSKHLASAEALCVFLGGSKSINDDFTDSAVKRTILNLKKGFIFDCNRNGYYELIDAWGLPLVYNRKTTSPVKWSNTKATMSTSTDIAEAPLHNPASYDLFSGNTYGLRILTDPARSSNGLRDFQVRALERNTGTSEHAYRYPYLREYVKRKGLTGNKANEYIGNW